MAQDVCLNPADASLASGLELFDGRLQLARQNSIAEFDDGTITGTIAIINSAGGIVNATLHPGFVYMQDGDDGNSDWLHFPVPGDGEHVIIKYESYGATADLNDGILNTLVSANTDTDGFGDDFISWLLRDRNAATHILHHDVRRLNKINNVTDSDTSANINWPKLRAPLWIKIARSGNNWTFSYRTRWDASFTDDVTLTNANILNGDIWIRQLQGNRYLIDWIRNDTAAFVTTSPAASWIGLSGSINTTNAAVDMLQANDSDIGLEGDDTVLANGTDRVEFRFNGGSFLSLTAWKALGVISPTTIDVRLISDGTQKIQISNILVGEAVDASTTILQPVGLTVKVVNKITLKTRLVNP